MRKPRDYDIELKLLNNRAQLLRDRKLLQLGELVVATGADTLAIEVLAGALIATGSTKDPAVVEAWRRRGAAFFQAPSRSRTSARSGTGGVAPRDDGAAPSAGQNGA